MNTTIQKLIASREILGPFLDSKDRKFTPHEVSRITGISYATCWRRLRELSGMGLLNWEKIGNYNAYKLNEKSPFLKEARKLLSVVSPHRKAATDFSKACGKIEGIEKMVLFGSVAKGREKTYSDIDIAIIAEKQRPELKERISLLASKISEKYHILIIPLFLTPREAERGRLSKAIEEGEILSERD